MTERAVIPLRVWLAAVPAAGPAGLVVYLVAGVSLPLAALCIGGLGIAGWTLIAVRSRPAARALARRAAEGAAAGAIATAAYDAARYGLVSVVQMSFSPFHVWEIFGRLFVGDGASTRTAFAVGAMYHVSNGIGLGVAYRLLVARPTWKNGILWAFGLELAMALLFPRWLRMTALAEFFTVSVVGHAVYGVVLAWACRRIASRRRAPRPATARAR